MTNTFHVRPTLVPAVILLACAAVGHVSANTSTSEADQAGGAVQVTVTYTGKGMVDPNHRLWIWLFDTPNMAAGSIPLAEMSLEKNGATATFPSVGADKVWVAIAYDELGGFGGSAPPPSGSPVTVFADKTGPAEVAPGPKAILTVTFDDTRRMP